MNSIIDHPRQGPSLADRRAIPPQLQHILAGEQAVRGSRTPQACGLRRRLDYLNSLMTMDALAIVAPAGPEDGSPTSVPPQKTLDAFT